MRTYWQDWHALASTQKSLSLLLLLMPVGIIFGRSAAMVCVFAFAVIALTQLATKKISWSMLDPVAKSGLVLGLILLLIATPFADASVLRSLKISLLFLCFPLFYITVTMVCTQDKRMFYPTLAATIFLLVIMLIDGAVQRITGVSLSGVSLAETSGRLTGILSHPNFTAAVASFLFIILAWWHMLAGNKEGLLMVAAVVCTLAVGAVSGERSAGLLFIISLLIGDLLLARNYRHMRPWMGVLSVLLVIILIAALHMPYMQERATHFGGQVTNFAYSLYGQLYQNALFLWLESPLTGVGAGNFRLTCPEMGARFFLDCNLHPHNYVLELLSEGGIFACIAWTFVIAAFAHLCLAAYRTPSTRILGIIGMMIGFFHLWPIIGTQSIFSTWRASLLWYSLAMWVAAYRSYALHPKQ